MKAQDSTVAVRSHDLLADLRERETGLRRQASNLLRQGVADGFRWCAAMAEGVKQAISIAEESANEKGQR
jgi:hypothetical protein